VLAALDREREVEAVGREGQRQVGSREPWHLARQQLPVTV